MSRAGALEPGFAQRLDRNRLFCVSTLFIAVDELDAAPADPGRSRCSRSTDVRDTTRFRAGNQITVPDEHRAARIRSTCLPRRDGSPMSGRASCPASSACAL